MSKTNKHSSLNNFASSNRTSNVRVIPAKKKIGFVSAVTLVIGSSIGAGIFIKNHEILNNVHGSILLAILSWVIAVVGILALALTLPEICSGVHNNHQGIIGWVRKFSNKIIYMSSKNFMTYLHLSIYYFIMPFYLVMTIQETFGFATHWYVLVLISFGISTWFIWITGLSAKLGNIQNWIVTGIKFLPIIFAILAGLIMVGLGKGTDNTWWPPQYPVYDGHLPLFNDHFPILGILSSIPAIFFAFDGFYSTAGIQGVMREPKKISLTMGLGMAIVSALDIAISLALLLGTHSGKLSGLAIPRWIIQVANICVTIGILGIINGVSIYSARYYQDLIKHREIPFADWLQSHSKPNSTFMGVLTSYVITIFWFIVFTIVGLFFLNSGHYGDIPGWTNGVQYGDRYVVNLYSFADLIGNWNAGLAFVVILFAVVGVIHNRKTNKIKVQRSKYLLPGAWTSLIIIGVGILFIPVESVGNLIYIVEYYTGAMPLPNYVIQFDINIEDIIGASSQILMLFIFLGIMFIPGLIRIRSDSKQGVAKTSHKHY
ncbi:MAG: APC family permease [Mycoplasmataceae bacterium]|nr:APC family permease [Mycoplasmataceae bacterium]